MFWQKITHNGDHRSFAAPMNLLALQIYAIFSNSPKKLGKEFALQLKNSYICIVNK